MLGAGGFLAGHIQRRYQGQGWRAIGVGRAAEPGGDNRRLTLPHANFEALLAEARPDLCVNAAGRSSVPDSITEPLADFEASAGLTFAVLDVIRRVSPTTTFIQLSSAAVYGEPTALPVSENARIAPISPYGWHRRLAEMVVTEHARQFGLKAACLRIFSAYGPDLHRQVVWDLACRAAADPAQSLVIQGCAEDSRDFVHGDDVAQAVQRVAEAGALNGECYNVAGGVETSIATLGAMIQQRFGDGELRFDDHRRPGKPGRWHASIERLTALGFAPQVSLTDGVGQVVDRIKHPVG